MDARMVLGIPTDKELHTYDSERICNSLIGMYNKLLADLPEEKEKLTQLIARAQTARDALIWEGWERTVQVEEPWNDYTGKPPHEKLRQMLADYAAAPDLDWVENEPDKEFRDRAFHGKDRVLLMLNHPECIDLGDISEHDTDGRIRQGYLAELCGEYDTARQIYESVGFTERLNDDEGPLLDTEVEHYG